MPFLQPQDDDKIRGLIPVNLKVSCPRFMSIIAETGKRLSLLSKSDPPLEPTL